MSTCEADRAFDLSRREADYVFGGIKLVSSKHAPDWVWPEGVIGIQIAPGFYVVPDRVLKEIKRTCRNG